MFKPHTHYHTPGPLRGQMLVHTHTNIEAVYSHENILVYGAGWKTVFVRVCLFSAVKPLS